MKKSKLFHIGLPVLTAIFIANISSFALAQSVFSDLSTTHQNYTAIVELQKRGVIGGYPDGSFKPDKTVNRVEALKMIVLANNKLKTKLESAAKDKSKFPDTEAGSWYIQYLNTAFDNGIVSGYLDGKFRPDKTINLVESLKMVLKGWEVDLSSVTVLENPYVDAFKDQWYAKYVEYAKAKNLIDRDVSNKVYPDQDVTRGKLAEMIYRLMRYNETGIISAPKIITEIPKTVTTGGAGGTTTTLPTTGTSGTATSTGTSTATAGAGPIAGAMEARVDIIGSTTAISPYIYGVDKERVLPFSGYHPKTKPTFVRAGGNDWTAYNWENNATNDGIDGGPNENIGVDKWWEAPYESSDKPGEAAAKIITGAHNLGAAALITIPINDHVAADKNGIVKEKTTEPGITRWVKNNPTKPTALSLTPNLTDKAVYQDEFVNFIQQKFKDALAQGKKIFYSLDNEPALWSETHALLHPAKTTYAEMANRTKEFGAMIKRIAPNSLVFGSVAYGFNELITLQDAPDRAGREYIDFYLDSAKNLETSEGKRIVDVLDIHWYPEVKVAGVPIVVATVGGEYFPQSANPSKAEMEARMNAPRSLWDPAYIENSWIATDYLGKPYAIRLIPWLKERIASHYPGTKIAITEYNYGDGYHVSHAMTQADVLGVFGREGVFAANLLPLYDSVHKPLPNSYITGAFDMYLDYDGKGSAVGDLSIIVNNPDVARLSLYAMRSSGNANLAHIVAINKTDTEIPLNFKLNGGDYKTAISYRLSEAGVRPKMVGTSAVADNNLSDRLPPLSVTTFEIRK